MRFVPENFLQGIEEIGSYDLIVSILSRNNADTIEFVL